MILFFFTVSNSFLFSQDIPGCISNLNKNNSYEIKEFAGKRILKDGRSVYKIIIKRPAKCMDCPSGVTYVDSVCTTVAAFTIGFAPHAYLKEGYAAGEFLESHQQVFKIQLMKTKPLPACIAAVIAKPDSLKAAGIEYVWEILIGGRNLFYFEKQTAENKNCRDCATQFAYYDSVCSIAATFSVGGIAGITASAGFTKKDYSDRRVVRNLWSSANKMQGASMPSSAVKKAQDPFPNPVNFIVTTTYNKALKIFKAGDKLTISTAEGLYHYRNNKLVNQYKIIPQKIKQTFTMRCIKAPCPAPTTIERIVFYLESYKKYVDIQNGSLLFSKNKYDSFIKAASIEEPDWNTECRLKKKI